MKDWQKRFAYGALEKGARYFRQGKVEKLILNGDDKEYFEAFVEGSYYDHPYHVYGRYRLDGRVSELYCSCPWAQKGHYCKHMVATLMLIDQKRDQENQDKFGPKIKLIDKIDDFVARQAKNKQLSLDILKIVSNEEFYETDYHEADILAQNLIVDDYEFDTDSDGVHHFILILKNGFLSFGIRIDYSASKVMGIFLDSQIQNFNEMALKIIGLKKFVEYFVTDNPGNGTNHSARFLLSLFKQQEQEEEPIVFRAQIEKNYDDFYLTFKIGTSDHLYKVQNVATLVDYSDRSDKLKLGKFFNRQINVRQMDSASQKWFNFARDLVTTNQALAEATNNYYYLNLKELPLAPNIADKVDQLQASGAPIYVDNTKIDYQVKKIKLPLKIEVNPEDQTTTIKVGTVVEDNQPNTIFGSKNYYRYEHQTWTRYEGVDPVYLNQSGIFQNDRLVFGAEDWQTLGRNILPKLVKSDNFEIEGQEELKKALPPEADISYRLDLQDSNIILKAVVNYGDDEYQLMQKSSDGTIREYQKEEAALDLIKKLGFTKEDNYYQMELGSSKIDYFVDQGINQLKQSGKVEITAAFKRLLGQIKAKSVVSLGIRLSENTLDLTVKGEKLTPEDVQSILKAYQEKRHYFLLKNGEMRQVDEPSVETLAKIMNKLGLTLKQFVKGKMAVPAYRSFYLEKQLEKRNQLAYTSNSAFDKLIADIDQGVTESSVIPKKLTKVLRPYQVKGFKWMSTLINYNFGALLADEMGLGKTLQVISVLLSRKEKTALPSLVVVPASVVYNWKNEIKKFAPELKVLTLGGNKKERLEQLKEAKQNDVLIISYDSLKRDIAEYQNLKFDLEVIDEAQNIKNAKTAVAKAVKVINSNHRLALTGTPIENNLSELWSIFDYLMPGFLGEYDYFKSRYEKPIVKDGDKKAEKELSQIISPFILRRLKKDVLKDLPNKNEEIVSIKMAGKQAQIYDANVQKLINQLDNQDEQDFKKQRFQVLAAITKLRELCCDPHLLYEDYRGKSAKLEASLDLIQNSTADGHKILLFSQFTSMLEIIKQRLAKLKIETYVITGSTPKKKRQELIKEFNNLQKPAVFLISLKAGGTGINLTSADVVIHYDPWWNQAAENQATDRAHRIGQKHDVSIYKMVAKDTIEERIIELQTSKKDLSDAILGNNKLSSSKLNKDDLLKILER